MAVKFLRKPLLSLVVFLLLLGGAELSVRLFFSESLKSQNIHAEAARLYAAARMLEAVERDGLRYRGRPGAAVEIRGVRYEHNSLGLRGPEPDQRLPSRRFRILLLGDSNTYGWGVPFEQTFGQVAERLLNERLSSERRIEIINAGFVGYNSGDAEALYRSLEDRVRPDLVLLVWHVNDLERFGFHVDRDGHLFCDPLASPDSWKSLLWSSRIYRKLAVWKSDRLKLGTFPPGEAEYRWSEEKIAALQEGVARSGRGFAILDLPLIEPSPGGARITSDGYICRDQSLWLAGVARRLAVPLHELLPSIQERGAAAYWVQLDPPDHHPNRLAHEKFADSLSNFLIDRKLVPTTN